MITIIDYNCGNVGSIKNMVRKIGYDAEITNDLEKIANADKLILPGVGHFDYCIQQLHEAGLVPILNKKVLEDKTPILGVCVGIQLMSKSSEEGIEKGLGWFDAQTVKFKQQEFNLKLPHMNWNEVKFDENSKLFKGMYEEARFYFVHSYHLTTQTEKIIVWGNYEYDFVAGIEKDNIIGVQFHPEKSHKFGMQLYRNFIENY
jgi:glutamine amidotransferase